jgi:hypothetical protein
MSIVPRVVRNVRNNNPGNLESGEQWAGLMPPLQMNADQRAEPRFCVFVNATMGFRALAKTLRTYRYTHDLDTISKIVEHYAPPAENVTDAYIAHVALDTGIDPDAQLDLNDAAVLTALCRAIAVRESAGQWLFDAKDLGAGVDLALYPSVRGLVS